MLKSKQLRKKAWDSLKGKYWLAILATIITSVFISVCAAVTDLACEISGIAAVIGEPGVQVDNIMLLGAAVIIGMVLVLLLLGVILFTFVYGPAIIGSCKYFIVNTESKPSLSELFAGFKTRYGRNCYTMLLADVKLTLWYFLLVIPGIIKSFEYAIIPYILADDPEISAGEAFKKAKAIMKGNKWRLFKLNFSFIGWFILTVLIGTAAALINPYLVFVSVVAAILLTPYVDAANAEFYVELKNK